MRGKENLREQDGGDGGRQRLRTRKKNKKSNILFEGAIWEPSKKPGTRKIPRNPQV